MGKLIMFARMTHFLLCFPCLTIGNVVMVSLIMFNKYFKIYKLYNNENNKKQIFLNI